MFHSNLTATWPAERRSRRRSSATSTSTPDDAAAIVSNKSRSLVSSILNNLKAKAKDKAATWVGLRLRSCIGDQNDGAVAVVGGVVDLGC